MHSVAIFFGVLIFGLGLHCFALPLLIIWMPDDLDGPGESFWDRWAAYLVAAIMLLLPLTLTAGGGTLVWWAFATG
jgi:hypothetical protein